MNRDELYLRHILDAIRRIETYIGDRRYEQFVLDPMRVDGVLRQLEIIGEATNNLSGEFREHHPNIPHADIIAMRNRLIHAYAEVDLEIVWGVWQRNLPVLQKAISTILENRS